MANPIAKEMAQEYCVTPKKTASLLDTFSCIFQGVIPYGAQMLVAISAAHELGYEISATAVLSDVSASVFFDRYLWSREKTEVTSDITGRASESGHHKKVALAK